MPIKIEITAESGAQAAMELRNLALSLMIGAAAPPARLIRKEEMETQPEAPPAPKAEKEPVASPSAAASAKAEDAKPELKAEEKLPETSSVVEAKPEEKPVSARRAGRGKKEAAPDTTPPAVSSTAPAEAKVQQLAAEKVAETAPKEGEDPTFEYCCAKITELSTKKSLDAAHKLILSFKVERLQMLPKEKYKEFVEAVDKELAA